MSGKVSEAAKVILNTGSHDARHNVNRKLSTEKGSNS